MAYQWEKNILQYTVHNFYIVIKKDNINIQLQLVLTPNQGRDLQLLSTCNYMYFKVEQINMHSRPGIYNIRSRSV